MNTLSMVMKIIVIAVNCYTRAARAFSNHGGGDGSSYYHYMSDDFIGDLSRNNSTLFLEGNNVNVSTNANSFTTVGMPITGDNVKDYIEASDTILREKSHLLRMVSIPGMDDDECKYVVYPSKSGGQLWGTLHERIYFGGFVPHFEGKSRIKMCIMTTKPDPCVKDDGTVCKGILDGSLMGVPDEDGEALDFLYDSNYVTMGGIRLYLMVAKTDKGLIRAGYGFANPDSMRHFFSFEFACPNFAFLNRHTSFPVAVTIQLSAFAREIRTFDSVGEYELKQQQSKKQKTKKKKHYDNNIPDSDHEGIETHIASKFFGSECYPENKNNRCACIVGHVVDAELRRNELTQQPFYWALIRTAEDMEIDVVIHPRLCSIKPPQIGGVIQGYFYLSGLLLLDGSEE